MAKDIEKSVRSEIQGWIEYVKSIPWEELKKGDWFFKLIGRALSSYANSVSPEYFHKKYPGVPRDGIADRLIDAAIRYAALAGGVSGAIVSAAEVSSAISAGGTLTIAGATLMGELFYVTQLQLKLIYDLSVVYDRPIDLDDPEDILSLFSLALGIKAGEVSGSILEKLIPRIVRT